MTSIEDIIEAFKLLSEVKPIEYEYRLYYDRTNGVPLKYSVDDEGGDYIVISKKDYDEASFLVKIVNNKLIKPVHPRFLIMHESTGGFTVDPYDWTVLVDPDEPHLFVDTVKVEDIQHDNH